MTNNRLSPGEEDPVVGQRRAIYKYTSTKLEDSQTQNIKSKNKDARVGDPEPDDVGDGREDVIDPMSVALLELTNDVYITRFACIHFTNYLYEQMASFIVVYSSARQVCNYFYDTCHFNNQVLGSNERIVLFSKQINSVHYRTR